MKRMVLGVLLFLAAITALITVTASRSGAQAVQDNSEITGKLEMILAGQKSILEDMAYIKEELRIIKVRVTQAQ